MGSWKELFSVTAPTFRRKVPAFKKPAEIGGFRVGFGVYLRA
jgi:hypothetical protein